MTNTHLSTNIMMPPSTASGNDKINSASASEGELSKVAIIRNLVMISMSFLLCFTSYHGTRNLQSSLYPENNLGNNTSAVQTFATILSNLLICTIVMNKLGLKWSLVLSLSMRFTYPAANLYPVWYSMYTGAAIAGIAGGPLWNAKSTYLSILGEKYAQLSGESEDVVLSFFFGVFFMVYRGSMFTGNIISSIVIRRPSSIHVQSDDNDAIIQSLCGAHYCYEDLDIAFARGTINLTNSSSSIEAIYHPTTFQINLLCSIYVLCALLAVPLALFVDPISTSGETKSQNVVDALLETMRHMKNSKEMLLMPLSLLNGVTFAFITADFCVGFITCSVGIDNVGYVMMVFGGTAGIGSGLAGPLQKLVGRKVIFTIGGLCNVTSLVGMLTWLPGSQSMVVLCVLAGLWGIANAVWSSQLVSFIAFVFRDGSKEAAFACNYIWQMGGICLWNGLSLYMCLYVQIYVITSILMVSMATYIAIELMLSAEEAKQKKSGHSSENDEMPPEDDAITR